MTNQIIKFNSPTDLKVALAGEYRKNLDNFFGDQKKSLEFLSNVVAEVQKNPKLLECTQESVLNSFMTMASLKFMPSSISGEAYVLPYGNQAQFQLGYQGLVTLFFRAGVEKISADIIREKDNFSMVNGELKHEIDLTKSMKERGSAIGAYVTVIFKGQVISKFMNSKDILEHGRKFSKSFDTKGKYSPWNEANDPELWMWKKTVLKQAAKLLPKNETINRALAEDNKDSNISENKERGLLPPKEIDVESKKKELQKAKDLDDLQFIWDSLSTSEKLNEELKKEKDILKEKFTIKEEK